MWNILNFYQGLVWKMIFERIFTSQGEHNEIITDWLTCFSNSRTPVPPGIYLEILSWNVLVKDKVVVTYNLNLSLSKIHVFHNYVFGLFGFSNESPWQSSSKLEHTLVCICMDKEGAFQFEAWSMDFNKKRGVFERESPWIFKKRGYFHNVLSMIVNLNLNLNHLILVDGKLWTSL